jgi:fumarate hydratase class I
MPEFTYQNPLPVEADKTTYYKIEGSEKYVTVEDFGGEEMLRVCPEAIAILANTAMRDVSFLLRKEHNDQVGKILMDPEASRNDKGVAMAFLRNAMVAAQFELPTCQDTGTATVVAKKGQQVWTGVNDAEYISKGIYKTYTEENLRYSQTVALDMYTEKNTGTNLPAQIDLFATEGDAYKFLFIAKGGGSANKTMLFQETKALLTPEKLFDYLVAKMKTLGTAACPPYHLAFVIGGTSADAVMKTVKLARWKKSYRKQHRTSASVPSLAVSTSLMTCALSVCPATAPPALWAWLSLARRTVTSRPRSPETVSLSKKWIAIRAACCQKSTAWPSMSTAPNSTSTSRWRTSWRT